jgi:hypothetical protein
MKDLRLCAKLGALTPVVAAASIALRHPYKATANDGNRGLRDGATCLIPQRTRMETLRIATYLRCMPITRWPWSLLPQGGQTPISAANWARGGPTARLGWSIWTSLRTPMGRASITRLGSRIAAAE